MRQELTKSEKISMSITEIAKEVRKDLKKEFGKKIKFSVRSHKFAGGTSLSVDIKKCSKEFLETENEVGTIIKLPSVKEEVRTKINDIVNFYNFDESDPMIDYFCVNFYYHGVGGYNVEVI